MQVQQKPLYQFLEGSGKSFIIPVYQRDYAWTKVNCQKLWDDMMSLNPTSTNKNARADHFLGTLVTIGSGFEEYAIIDGQQRLTTASLLLIALHNYLKKMQEKSAGDSTLEQQILDFLINKYSPEKDKRIRLKPNKQDKMHFEMLFENDKNLDNTSNIISNYYFFVEKIASGEITPQQLFNVFRKLEVVLIDLVRGQDDPQLIFESLNSTGVDLTSGDLIRNYILMDLEPVEQERMYKNYWVEIEKLAGDVAEFVRNYLIYKTKTSVKKDDVYGVFKSVALEEFNKDKQAILQELLNYAEIYSWFVQNKYHGNEDVNVSLKRLHELEFTVCYPYLLDVFSEIKNKNIGEDVGLKVLKILESYAFRKILVDNSTQGLNKLFISLARDIKKEESWKSQYIDILSYILLEKRSSQRFPGNEEFEAALVNKEVYKLQSKNRNFLLESLENYNSAYHIDLDNSDSLSVEHVMPQTLTKAWKNKLGDNWQEIHNKYLHTLGNLTLTAKNSSLSNNDFEEKQKIDFQTSKLKLNFKLENVDKWGETEILVRAKSLIKDVVSIWPSLKTNFVKPTAEEQLYDLASEDDFSHTKPLHLYLGDKEQAEEIHSWRDMLIKTCKFLYEYSPTQFKEMQNNVDFAWYFGQEKKIRRPLEFLPNEFVEGNMSAGGIIGFLTSFCARMNYPLEKIQFSLKNAIPVENTIASSPNKLGSAGVEKLSNFLESDDGPEKTSVLGKFLEVINGFGDDIYCYRKQNGEVSLRRGESQFKSFLWYGNDHGEIWGWTFSAGENLPKGISSEEDGWSFSITGDASSEIVGAVRKAYENQT